MALNILQVEETWDHYKEYYKETNQYRHMIIFLQKEAWKGDGNLETTWAVWVTILLPILSGSVIS